MRRSAGVWLAGLVLLVTAALLFVALAPVTLCPQCKGGRTGFLLDSGPVPVLKVLVETPYNYSVIDGYGNRREINKSKILSELVCERCGGKKRVTLLNRWRER